MPRPRIKLSRWDVALVGAIALVAGALAVISGPRPTGTTTIDVVMVVLAVGLAVWCAASTPWWACTIMAGVAAVLATGVLWVLLGIVAVIASGVIGRRQRSSPWSRAATAGVAIVVLAHAGNRFFFGGTAVVGIGVTFLVALLGLLRRPSGERRWIFSLLGSLAGLVVLALIAFGVSAASARADLERGVALARDGVSQISKGDFAGAQTSFQQAGGLFAKAHDAVSTPWAQPARVVPGIAQNRNAVAGLIGSAAHSLDEVAAALGQVNVDSLKLTNGAIDLDALRKLVTPLLQLNDAVDQMENTVSSIGTNPWVVHQITDRLTTLDHDLRQQQQRGLEALHTVQLAPDMLGASGPRVYFVAFVSPAEARGGGGFMGNWAEFTANAGKITMTKFGRHEDLDKVLESAPHTMTASADWLASYGQFGFTSGPNGTLDTRVWTSVTMSANFPSTAQAIAELYPMSGGQQLDGVVQLDASALAGLLSITGPVQVPGTNLQISSANAAQYLLFDQYKNADQASGNSQRVDALEAIAAFTVKNLFSSTLPSPPKLAATLAPLAAAHHLLAWAQRPNEQALFTQAHMDGALPSPIAGTDVFAFSFTNRSGNKLDAYLTGKATFTRTGEGAQGYTTATATLTMTNTAPTSGLADYVIGNFLNLPKGTNRSYVTLYSSSAIVQLTVDGKLVPQRLGTEAGLSSVSAFVDISAGQTVTVTLQVEGPRLGSARTTIVSPPLVHDFPVTVIRSDGTIAGTVKSSGTATISR